MIIIALFYQGSKFDFFSCLLCCYFFFKCLNKFRLYFEKTYPSFTFTFECCSPIARACLLRVCVFYFYLFINMREFKKGCWFFVLFIYLFFLLALFLKTLLIVVLGFCYCCYWLRNLCFALISAVFVNRRNLLPITVFFSSLFMECCYSDFDKLIIKKLIAADFFYFCFIKVLLFGLSFLCTSTLICPRPASRTTWASPVLRSCQHRRRRSSVSPLTRRTARTRRSPSLRSFAVPPPGGA